MPLSGRAQASLVEEVAGGQKDDRRDLVVPTQILLTLRQPIFTRWNDD